MHKPSIHDIWCALFGTGTKCITLMFCYRRDKDTQYGGLSDLEKKKWQHLSIGNLISAINNILDQILSKKNILHFLLDFQKGKCFFWDCFSVFAKQNWVNCEHQDNSNPGDLSNGWTIRPEKRNIVYLDFLLYCCSIPFGNARILRRANQ